jgi:hypothetical protein
MSMSAKRERALLNSDEITVLRSTHHPDIYDLNQKELTDLQARLRNMRDKARTLARQKQREAREEGAQSPQQARSPDASHRSGA